MIYDIFTLGESDNYVSFNDESQTDYYIRASRRQASNREIRQFDSNVPDEMGVVDYQTLVGRSYYIIEGKIYPGNGLETPYKGMATLRKVCNPKIAQDSAYSDGGYINLKWTEDGAKQLRVKPLYVDIPETVKKANTPSFKILCKVRYPFIEAQTATSLTLTSITTAGTGIEITETTGLVIPVGGVVIGADTGGASGSLTNNGDYKAYPVITFTGPLNIPKLTNTTTGKYIEFNYNLTSGTITVTIDYDGVTAVGSDGTNLLQYLTATSSLDDFAVEVGTNAYTLTATTLGSGSSCQISARDTFPLS